MNRYVPFVPLYCAGATGCRAAFYERYVITQGRSGDWSGVDAIEVPSMDLVWPDGTGTSQFDVLYADLGVTLATGATRNLDLRALTGPDGTSQVAVEVRAIFVRCRDYALTFAKGASNGWTALGAAFQIKPPAGSWFRLVTGTNGALPTTVTDKVIDISNASGSTATYDLIVLGVSA